MFVYYSDIRGKGYRYLKTGEIVEYTLLRKERGLVAKDVQVVSSQNKAGLS